MDRGFYLALGVTLLLPFLQYALPVMPRSVAWTGVAAGILVMLIEFLAPEMKPSLPVVLWFLVGALCFGWAGHLYFQQSPHQTDKPIAVGDPISQKPPTPLAEPKQEIPAIPPTLFTLFMTDFHMKFTGVTTNWTTDIDIGNGAYKTVLFYNLHYDVAAHTKFASVFTEQTSFENFSLIARFVSENVNKFFADDQKTIPFTMKGQGDSDINSVNDIPFSGRVYAYYFDALSIEQQAELTKLFREKGMSLQIRGPEYVFAVFDSIKSGRAKMPPRWRSRRLPKTH